MIFSLLVLVAIALIAFFHYMQGLFSATISAMLAVLAAMLAFSYHEVVVGFLPAGKMADSANALVLMILFAVIYFALRLAFDKLVPGNIQVPVMVDKIGGAAMGVVAGVFATGVVAVAAQSLPFGAGVLGYSRFAVTSSREVQGIDVPGMRQKQDISITDELTEDSLDPNQAGHLLLPVDDMVVGLAGMLSDGGSLAGERSLKSVHPDYLQELFGQRVGLQPLAKHTAVNGGKLNQVQVLGVYQIGPVPQMDSEMPGIRSGGKRELPKYLRVDESQMIVVVRVHLDGSAMDEDNIFRFSPSAIRLCAKGKNYFPVGTLDVSEAKKELYSHRLDDPLFVPSKTPGMDLVFVVDKGDVLAANEGAPKSQVIGEGVFLEVKRMARVSLAGAIKPEGELKASTSVGVMRKGSAAK